MLKPLSELRHPREVIRQFTPNWFAVVMGTGVLSAALLQFPAFSIVAEGLWYLAIVLFIMFALLYSARWILFFKEASNIFEHSTISMFLGTIPMAIAVIINGMLIFGIQRWGNSVIVYAELLWWFDVLVSILCGVGIPFLMFTYQKHSINQMTALWLLPVVAAEVVAATGGLLAPHLIDANAQLIVLVSSYILWAFSVPIACSFLVILLLRMALHKLPHENMAASSWLTLGPISTGALGLLTIGAAAPSIFTMHGMENLGSIAAGIGILFATILWGFGLWWMLLALLITQRYFRSHVPFNLGWWGYTFPLGVYTLVTFRLGAVWKMTFFNIFGSVLLVALALMWLIVALRTAHGAYHGTLFVSPCIAKE